MKDQKPGCPKAEAPKVEERDRRYCMCKPDDHTRACNERMEEMADDWAESQRKPAPAPEPKQGSEEPIDLPKWDLPLAEPGISSRLSDESIERLAHLMATETSWDHAKVNSHADELARAYLALRAEVEALKAAVRDGVVLLEAAHRYVLDADAQFFAFEIEQYIRAQKEHAHE